MSCERPIPDPDARAAFVAAMRRAPAAVTIVATDGPAGRHGATVSALSSVSADPPTVLVCLNSAGRLAATVRENASFSVSFVPEGAEAVARRFADPALGSAARFAGADWTDWPALAGATALLARVVEARAVATHLVVVGRVVRARTGEGAALGWVEGGFARLHREAGG